MSKMSGFLLLIFAILALIFLYLWLGCLGDAEERQAALEKCQTDLEECENKVDPAAVFDLILENDAFGTFQPLNNQLRGQTPAADYRSGFFAQLGVFAGARHAYEVAQLTLEDGTQQTLARGTFVWIDIACQPTTAGVITPSQAQGFLPDAGNPNRKLHVDLLPDALVTMWNGAGAVRVSGSAFIQTPEEGDEHGHDKFTFASPDACEVQIWDDLTAAGPAQSFPATGSGSVKEIRIKELSVPSKHGGVHSPPWG